MILNKENYELAKVNGLLERLRGDEISRRIGEIIPMSEQIALIQDKEKKPDKYEKFQALRTRIKNEVDADIARFENAEGE